MFLLIVFSLATFNVQKGNLTFTNSTSGQVCFTCYFLEGSQSQGCYIEYNSLITDYYSGNITIVRTSADTSTASKCVTGIYTSNYNVTFYDIDQSNEVYLNEYAVNLADITISGLPIAIQTSSTLHSSFTTQIISSSFSSPTIKISSESLFYYKTYLFIFQQQQTVPYFL